MKYMGWSRTDLDHCFQEDYDEILALIEEERQEAERKKFQH